MVSGIMVAVLKELHADNIVLSDSTRLPLAAGLVLKGVEPGSHVMIAYNRDDDGGGIVVQNITARTSSVLSRFVR